MQSKLHARTEHQRLACSGLFGDARQVSFGEGQMGMSLKNVEGRAEVSKVESGECFFYTKGERDAFQAFGRYVDMD